MLRRCFEDGLSHGFEALLGEEHRKGVWGASGGHVDGRSLGEMELRLQSGLVEDLLGHGERHQGLWAQGDHRGLMPQALFLHKDI